MILETPGCKYQRQKFDYDVDDSGREAETETQNHDLCSTNRQKKP